MKGQGVKAVNLGITMSFTDFADTRFWFQIWSFDRQVECRMFKMVFTAYRVTLLILEMSSGFSTFTSSLSWAPFVTLSTWQCRATGDDVASSFWLEHETNELLQRNCPGTILEFHLVSFHQSTNLEAEWVLLWMQMNFDSINSPSSFIFFKTLTTSPMSRVSSSGSSDW